MAPRSVFITGGTGYLGRRLIPRLIERGHEVAALVRPGSERKLPSGSRAVPGNALDQSTFTNRIKPADTFVQLVGVPHPGPAKAKEFRAIDLVSARESVAAAVAAGVDHFVYVSVAQPAPVMKVYQDVRAQGEAMIRASGMKATLLRPWYILGPGHRWPYFLVPAYWLFEWFPATRASARRLGLVTLPQMIDALLVAVENPPDGIRVVEVPEIRRSGM
jgi:nucleoside-diphosphate-sugar epimerase